MMAISRNPTQNERARPKICLKKWNLSQLKGYSFLESLDVALGKNITKNIWCTVFGIAKLQTSIIQAWFYSCFDLFWLSVWNFHLFVRMRTKLPRVPLQCWKPRDLHSSHFHICIFLLFLISTFHPPLFYFYSPLFLLSTLTISFNSTPPFKSIIIYIFTFPTTLPLFFFCSETNG